MKKVFISIGTAILGLVALNIAYFISYLLLSLLLELIDAIPLLNLITKAMFAITKNAPDMFSQFIAFIIAYVATLLTVGWLNKDEETSKLSCYIIGATMIVIHALSLILNMYYGNALLTSIGFIILSVCIIIAGKKQKL